MYGSIYSNKPSEFISEIMGNKFSFDLETETNKKQIESPRKQIEMPKKQITTNPMLESSNEDYKIGDKVYHVKFGEGMIIGIKNGIGNIFFDKEKSSKNILLNHPTLRKL